MASDAGLNFARSAINQPQYSDWLAADEGAGESGQFFQRLASGYDTDMAAHPQRYSDAEVANFYSPGNPGFQASYGHKDDWMNQDSAGYYHTGPFDVNETKVNNQGFGDFLSDSFSNMSGGLGVMALPFLASGFGAGGFPGAEGGQLTGDFGFETLAGTAGTDTALGAGLVPGETGGTPNGWGGLEDLLKKIGLGGPPSAFGTALSAGSGIFGLLRAMQMGKLAQTASSPEKTIYDPFGGQRGQYQQMLQSLMADPSRVTQLPGYKAGLDAVTRKSAAAGYLGSGNMATALFDYGGKAYGDEVARLSSLAGAGIGPSGNPAGGNLIRGTEAANNLYSQSLASLGYASRGLENLFKKNSSSSGTFDE